MKKIIPSLMLVSLVVLVSVLTSSCGLTKSQKEGINAFGNAASTLGAASKEQFEGGRERVIEMKRQQLAMERKTLPAKKPDGSKADREFYAGALDLDSGYDRKKIETRVAAVELLIQYGDLLVAFSENTQEKELTAAAGKFTESIKGFPDNPLTTAEIKGLGQLVIVAGKMWVEHEKKQALKQIIPLDGFSDPPAIEVSAEGIKGGFSLALPNLPFGVFSLTNLSLGAGFSIPFVGKPLSVRFNFCERESPFHLPDANVWNKRDF